LIADAIQELMALALVSFLKAEMAEMDPFYEPAREAFESQLLRWD